MIYYYNGVDWVMQSEIRYNMADIVAIAPDDVWAGGEQGAIFHYSGGGASGWEWAGEIDNYVIYSIDAADKDHVILGLDSNEVALWTPTGGWNRVNMVEPGSSVKGVLYLRPNKVFMVDGASILYNSFMYFSDDRTNWQLFGEFGAQELNDRPLAGCLDQNGDPLLWLVGDCGYIYHHDGTGWSVQARFDNYVNWNSVVALDENNVWASGKDLLLHYNGSEWIVEDTNMPTFKQMVAIDNRHVYAIGDSATNKKIYIGTAEPSPTVPGPTRPPWVKTPTPTPIPVPGPISGRAYDRETGAGIGNVYVRALPLEAGLRPGGGIANSSGNYTIPGLLAGTYKVYCDSNQGSGIRVYRDQWYNQKDSQYKATAVSSNTSGKDFPLYKAGIYPTPTPTPTPDFQAIMVASGDYNGDGFSDIAIFRGASGLWAVRGITRLYFGVNGDFPVSGDYDGDGTADVAVFRSSIGLWAARGVTRAYFGGSADQPIPGDYDGDGFCDIGIFRDSAGLWAVSGVTRVYFGGAADQPVTGDYDGDDAADIALFRSSAGLWAVRGVSRIYFGTASDIAVPGDYNGGGFIVPAIFRPALGMWAVRNVTRVYFGGSAYQPVPADYGGSVGDEIGLFRPDWSLWAIRGITRVYFGSTDDLPVTK